jgi:hypothetical protein
MAGAAAVARPTTGWVLVSKVAPDEHASAFVRLSVVGHQAKTPLALITKGLELRDELTHAGGELVRRHDDGDAAVPVAYNETGLFKIGQQHLADPGGYTGGVGERLRRRCALLGRPGSERVFEPFEMPDARPAEGLKVLVDFKVGRIEQENALGRLPVATGAPNLLHVLLERSGSVVVQDVANVRLVDERWSRLSEQIFRFDKWSLSRG